MGWEQRKLTLPRFRYTTHYPIHKSPKVILKRDYSPLLNLQTRPARHVWTSQFAQTQRRGLQRSFDWWYGSCTEQRTVGVLGRKWCKTFVKRQRPNTIKPLSGVLGYWSTGVSFVSVSTSFKRSCKYFIRITVLMRFENFFLTV